MALKDKLVSLEDLAVVHGEATDLKSAFTSSLTPTTMTGWEKGGFDTSNGTNYADNTRIRNQTKVGYSTGVCKFKLATGYKTLMYAWDLSGNYVGAYKTDGTWTTAVSGWKSVTEFDLSTVPNYVIKFSVTRDPSSSDISASEGENVVLYGYTDKSLTLNKAADAKTVGEFIAVYNTDIGSKLTTVNPVNWLDTDSITNGELNANGTVSASDTRFYTDYIPVSAGDKMKAFRGDIMTALYIRHVCLYDSNKIVTSGGTDSATSSYFTIPTNAAYCRITLDTDILTVNPMIVNDGSTPTSYSAYFDPYKTFTEDLVTPTSETAIQKIVNKTLKTTDLANHYACALPKGFRLRQTVGLPQTWYNINAISPLTDVFVTAGIAYTSQSESGVTFTNETAVSASNGFNIINMDIGDYNAGRERRIIAESLPDCTVLVMGDSIVDFDVITQKMLDHWTAQEKTLTLLGTLGSGSNKNEGRAGWKASDYLTNKQYNGVTNPFYNPSTETFDFSYYLTQQGYSAPDYVVINLGGNDLYNQSSYDAVQTTWASIKTIIDSIIGYNSGSNNIKVLLNLAPAITTNPAVASVCLPFVRNLFIKYNEYAIKQILTTYNSTKVRPTYCHLIINPETDLRDNIHPTDAGFEKMALEIVNQINVWNAGE